MIFAERKIMDIKKYRQFIGI